MEKVNSSNTKIKIQKPSFMVNQSRNLGKSFENRSKSVVEPPQKTSEQQKTTL